MRRHMTDPFERYLRLLGIASHPSGLDGLRTLVRRHLSAVPFENVAKLLLFDRQHQTACI
jgi:arylamine N-acetyltransferase